MGSHDKIVPKMKNKYLKDSNETRNKAIAKFGVGPYPKSDGDFKYSLFLEDVACYGRVDVVETNIIFTDADIFRIKVEDVYLMAHICAFGRPTRNEKGQVEQDIFLKPTNFTRISNQSEKIERR